MNRDDDASHPDTDVDMEQLFRQLEAIEALVVDRDEEEP
jgi:hypothetical protein